MSTDSRRVPTVVTGPAPVHPIEVPGPRRPGPGPVRLVAVLGITQTVGYGAMAMSIPVLITPMARDLGVSTTAVALGTAIEVVCGAAAAVPVGRVLDRFGGRWAMTGGSILGVLAVLGWSQVGGLWQYYVVAVVIGVALAASTYEAAFAVLVIATEPKARATTILWLSIVTAFSSSFYYPLTGALEAWLGWRSTLVVLAALMTVAIPLHLWVVPDRTSHRAVARGGVPVRAALTDGVFWLFASSFVAQAAAAAGVMIMLVTYLRDAGHSAQASSSLPLLIGVLSVPIRLALGWCARWVGMVLVSAVGVGIQGLGALVLWLTAESLWWAAIGIAAFGVGTAVATISRPAIVSDRYGAARYASIMAAMVVPILLARSGAPLVATWLQGGYLLVAAGLAAGAAVVLVALHLTVVRRAAT